MDQLPIKECKCTHSGQWHAYGDSERVYEVYTEDNQDIPEDNLLPFLFNLCGRKTIQSKDKWREDYFNADSYFSGYYTLSRQEDYYRFTFVQPFTD